MNRKLVSLADLCHQYGASTAPEGLVPLPIQAEKDLLWLKSQGKFRLPDEYLKYYIWQQPDIGLYSCLDRIEEMHGADARRIVVNWCLFYGLLELAVSSNVVPWPLPQEFSERVLLEIQSESGGFWADRLGLPLLTELYRRHMGLGVRQIDESHHAESLFKRFLMLNSYLRTETHLEFLFHLHRYEVGEYRSQLEDALASPLVFAKYFSLPISDLPLEGKILIGVSRSFHFLRELFDLLESSQNDNPFVADNIWTYCRYWTDMLSSGQGMVVSSMLLDAFDGWASKALDKEALSEIQMLRNMISQLQERSKVPVPA